MITKIMAVYKCLSGLYNYVALLFCQGIPFVRSCNLSYHDLLLEQSRDQLVKVVPWRQHRDHKEMIHGLYKLYR